LAELGLAGSAMLNIRPEQMAIFEKDGARRFEDEMISCG
jgi:hypothetical protein